MAAMIELSRVPAEAEDRLTARERQRAGNLSSRRRQSFIAVRLCLKRLAARIFGELGDAPASAIETLAPDGVRPCLPRVRGAPNYFCSAAHDRRFAFALACVRPVGVDVESAADKALRGRRIFMGTEEALIVDRAEMGGGPAALRAWSIKESAAKALDMDLVDAWRGTLVVELGLWRSRARIGGGEAWARHFEVEGHLFTWLMAPGAEG